MLLFCEGIRTEREQGVTFSRIAPTYLEPGCCYRALCVALIQWDDRDDVLSVRFQSGQSVRLTVTSDLNRLYTSAFVDRKRKYVVSNKCDMVGVFRCHLLGSDL